MSAWLLDKQSFVTENISVVAKWEFSKHSNIKNKKDISSR